MIWTQVQSDLLSGNCARGMDFSVLMVPIATYSEHSSTRQGNRQSGACFFERAQSAVSPALNGRHYQPEQQQYANPEEETSQPGDQRARAIDNVDQPAAYHEQDGYDGQEEGAVIAATHRTVVCGRATRFAASRIVIVSHTSCILFTIAQLDKPGAAWYTFSLDAVDTPTRSDAKFNLSGGAC